jgi:GNAT superfamily N-acetyltransferase
MTIRTVVPDDAAAVVAVSAPIEPTTFATARSFRALIERGAPEGTERLVAEVDGAIVAWAPSGVRGDGSGWFWVGVDAAHRRRGIGSALYDRIDGRLRGLRADVLRTQINDEDGRAFVEHRGFTRTNVMRLQALELQSAQLPEATVETEPLSSVDVDSIRELFKAAYVDIPARATRPPFTDDDFQREVVDSDVLDRDVSTVLVEDGRVLAFTLIVANHEQGRAGAQMTGVARDRRGRGLAQAVKLASLHRARAAGLRTMLTSNDLENEPMLAINRKLGFEPSVLVEHYEKTL